MKEEVVVVLVHGLARSCSLQVPAFVVVALQQRRALHYGSFRRAEGVVLCLVTML